MKPSRISCSPVAWWGLLLALCTGLGHAQTNTRWVEGLEAVGGIPLNLVQAMTPAGPKPLASIPSARPCLSELERHRQQLEDALVPANPGQPGHPAQAAQAAPAKPAPLMQGPTAAQTETLQALYNEIRTVCQESAVLESPPSVGHPHPLDLAIPTAPDGPPPRDRRALYALEAQADQEEQSLNGILALRQSTQRQLQQLQSRLPVDSGADPAAPDTPAGAAADPWNRLIAEARLSLAGHQLQRLQGLDALLARQLASGTQASKVLQSRLSAWRGQVPFKPEELALIRTRLLDRIHRLESPAANAMARPEAVPGLPSAVSDTGMIQQGFWSQLLRQAQIDLDRRNLLAWQWRYELSQPDPGGLDTLAPQLSRQAQDLQALERSIGPLLDSASQTDTRAAAPAQALQGGFLQNELLATLALLNETRQNMRILGTELQHQLEAQNPLRRAWDRARHGVSAGASQVWDFNLLTLKEKITVNGQDITATQNVTVGKSFGAVLVLLVGYVAGTWVLRLTRLGLVRVLGVQAVAANRFYLIAKAVMIAALVVLAMRLVNIPLSVFSLLGGVLAVGLGFGAQNLLKNLIGALILQLTHPVKLGDYIVLNQHSGFVKSMGWQFCVVRGFDGDETIVPNVDMLSGSLVNWTFKDLQMRRSITVGVAYGSPTQTTMDLLVEAAQQAPCVLKAPAPVVYFTDFGDSALVFQLKFWVEMGALNPHVIETAVRLRINEAMKAANITISFPQRDLHLYQTEPLHVDICQK